MIKTSADWLTLGLFTSDDPKEQLGALKEHREWMNGDMSRARQSLSEIDRIIEQIEKRQTESGEIIEKALSFFVVSAN